MLIVVTMIMTERIAYLYMHESKPQPREGLGLRARACVVGALALIGSVLPGCIPEEVVAFCGENPQVCEDIAVANDQTNKRVTEINSTMAPSDAALYRLANCESTNNPKAVNKSGKYMGLYQFDQRTWNGVMGGAAALPGYVNVKPNKAPEDVQDAAARILYKYRGAQPWPECGKRI